MAPSPLYKPLIPLVLIRSCAILAADLGGVPDLVPNVLRFELAAATAEAVLATRGFAIGKTKCSVRREIMTLAKYTKYVPTAIRVDPYVLI